ncbi:MAG: TonB C-terminal domain-containing protein [Nannocystaceae bacterium]
MSKNDPEVRPVPALLSPFIPISRELAAIVRNPQAFVGGIVGTALISAGMWALLTIPQANAEEPDADELEMEFIPGALVRQGEKIDPEKLPEKMIVEETVAAEESTADKVTTDEKAEPPPEKKKTDDNPEKTKSTQKPDPNKKNATKSDKNRDTNKQFKTDLPTVKDLPGDPFGSADGWADMAKDGDPWATGVIGALNKMKVASYAAQAKSGTYQFQITICANGTISKVDTKRSSGDAKLDNAVKSSVLLTKIPLPPTEVAKQLKGGCKKIPYRFTWSNGGKVR